MKRAEALEIDKFEMKIRKRRMKQRLTDELKHDDAALLSEASLETEFDTNFLFSVIDDEFVGATDVDASTGNELPSLELLGRLTEIG